ncbi:1-acyl-sn-glycerol-3-phosphate acyltransferase [Treponema sp. OMZ 788]|uniref:lysophospholipid acyltransferase family protein n=1 Tax=Treponema sp. OMZ 788 TaxID=2563664 RepID=UPI0020A3E751|nr:lysophospholipid acyltransferase family protein [Treponema sp. OMZ 788]UTC65322.1 1-acyl-sn-glycerol-3-phosphate acyltransferase [Treponema sp. OMZ 788]
MGALIAILCCLVLLTWRAVLIGVFHAVYRRGCDWVNSEVIVRPAPRLLFAVFKQYTGFKFEGDYSLTDQLPEQYLVISNHQSLLDIVAHMNYYNGTRLRFVAKEELGHNVPLVSPMLKSGKHCLVKRTGSPTQAMKAVDKFAEYVVKNNLIPVIFPEGSRSKDGELKSFHAAGFRRFLNAAPMPVAVCALDGAWKISSLTRLAKNLKNETYRVKLLKIYDAPKTKEDQVKILEEGKALIQAQLDEWRLADKQK